MKQGSGLDALSSSSSSKLFAKDADPLLEGVSPCSLVSRGDSTGKIAVKKCNVLLLVSECNFPAC